VATSTTPDKTPVQVAQEAADKAQIAANNAQIAANNAQITANALKPKDSVASGSASASSWAGQTKPGYLGSFIAANQVNIGGQVSWADVSPHGDIYKINIATLNPEAILAEAQKLDGDINGKSSTGSSIVKEGEEKFIFGAGYTGTQGVSITEVSGISASIVHGKKVVWTDGDLFVKVDGKEYITNITTEKLATKISAQLMKSENYAKIAISSNIAAPLVSSHTTSAVQNTSTASALKNTLTLTASNLTSTFALLNLTLTGAIYNKTYIYADTIFASNTAAKIIETINKAPTRIQKDFTKLTAQISEGNFFNVANNTFEAYEKSLKLINEVVSAVEMQTSETKLDIKKVENSIKNSGTNYQETKINIETKKLEQSNIDVAIDKSMTDIEEGDISIQKVNNSIIANTMNMYI
jgi:hypothetical protein